MKRTKLQLTWVGKEDRPRLEPRVLIEDESLSLLAATLGFAATGTRVLRMPRSTTSVLQLRYEQASE